MNIFEAIVATTPAKPFIQSPTQKAQGIKLKPKELPAFFEVYLNGEMINSTYVIQEYEYREQYEVVE